MFIILSYDVDAKRCAKYHRLCKKYLRPVHNSVFEGELTGSSLDSLKKQMERFLDPDEDSVRIYELHSTKFAYVSMLGKSTVQDNIL